MIHFSIENVMWGILHSCMKPYLSLLLGELGDVGRDLRGALLRVVEHLQLCGQTPETTQDVYAQFCNNRDVT